MELVRNCSFEEGLAYWFPLNGGNSQCRIQILPWRDLERTMHSTQFIPQLVVGVMGRTETWHGLAQDIGANLNPEESYLVTAEVAVRGAESAEVNATLALYYTPQSREPTKYIRLGSTAASSSGFSTLEGILPALNPLKPVPQKITAYLEGPPPGIDLLVSTFRISSQNPHPNPNPNHELNLVVNGKFQSGSASWTGMCGSELLSSHPSSPWGSPLGPPMQPSSLPNPEPSLIGELAGPTGAYLQVGKRTASWHGPKQCVGQRVVPFCTYAVSAWVRVGPPDSTPAEKVELSLRVQGQREEWVGCGAVEAGSRKWSRLIGSFRLEMSEWHGTAQDAVLYFQGPPAGVEIWVADVSVVPQGEQARKERIELLRERGRRVRGGKGRVRVVDGAGRGLGGFRVHLQQRKSSFPLGCCVCDWGLRVQKYREFVLEHFSHVVMENELKWAQMEARRGEVRAEAADQMLTWAEGCGLKVRGHCLVWDSELPPWLCSLDDESMANALDERIKHIVTRYKGRFIHYDVNNEMLRSDNIAKRLGQGAIVRLFQKSHQIDSQALLFVNDYHIEDGRDHRSTPEKYVEHIRELVKIGAPIHGIGIQGHITAPVGPHVEHALNVLGGLNLPIWITELDVSSKSLKCRADDLEVMLWEAFAHPMVQGTLLWGFWEKAMWRKDAFLVNEDWSLSEAGKRLEEVQRDWSSGEFSGVTDEDGNLKVFGLMGIYKGTIEGIGGESVKFELVLGQGEDWEEKCFVVVVVE